MNSNDYKYKLATTTKFEKELKKALKRGCDKTLFDEVLEKLLRGISLPESNYDHKLTGNFKNFRECHISPDWLLIYKIEEDILVLTLSRTGSHSLLFKEKSCKYEV